MPTAEEILAARTELFLRAERARGLTVVAGSLPTASAKTARAAAAAPAAPRATAAPLPPPMRPQQRPAVAPKLKPTVAASFPQARPAAAPIETAYSRAEKESLLAAARSEVEACRKCRLCEGRKQAVFGEGNPDAALMFVGEGPGETEDNMGRPFVGKAGELLNKMITAMGLAREDCFIANVVKCRPPENRTPQPDEAAACWPFLDRQIEIIRPKVIVALGLPATQTLLQVALPMGQLRSRWAQYRGIKLMPTYHPAYVLRQYTPEVRQMVWADLQQVMVLLGLKLSAK